MRRTHVRCLLLGLSSHVCLIFWLKLSMEIISRAGGNISLCTANIFDGFKERLIKRSNLVLTYVYLPMCINLCVFVFVFVFHHLIVWRSG